MEPIPAWVRRLWDIWDLRMLVLLSFTLQVILSVFGRRRKYITSAWISVLVWSAYIMADWVATVALGKLSDAQNQEKINALWVLWAPLLLLHLGGPDGIIAYSLEDNQLWLRHFVGLVVQLSVAIYVILMSWKNSWFSFMSIPALVAGIIKYGERTWVLYSVSSEKYSHIRVLEWALGLVKKIVLYNLFGSSPFHLELNMFVEDGILLDAVDVSMGLMYESLYTKAAAIYTKEGIIMRCISFGCTVSVLLGLAIQTVLLKTKEGEEIDTLITWVLIVGAVALEIYAAIVILSSDWMMIWLIDHGKEAWVAWLSKIFSSLFNKKKNWSNKVGKFDILGYWLKKTDDVKSPVRQIIRSVLGPTYEDKWDRHRYKTRDAVHPPVYDAILLLHRHRDDILNGSIVSELKAIWASWDAAGNEFRPGEYSPSTSLSATLVLEVHLLTEIFFHLEVEWDIAAAAAGGEDGPSTSVDVSSSSTLWKEDREVSKTLSDYMMYLLMMHPSLLPDSGSRRYFEGQLKDLEKVISRDVKAACSQLLSMSMDAKVPTRNIQIQKPPISGWIGSTVESLKGKEKTKRWEIIKLMWLKMLALATARRDQKDSHFHRLREGGELLTLIWFFTFRPVRTTSVSLVF